MNIKKVKLGDIQEKMSNSSVGSCMGLFADKLIMNSDSEVRFVVEKREEFFRLRVMCSDITDVCGLDFYENNNELGQVFRSSFIRILAACTRGVPDNTYNAQIEFYNQNKKVLIDSQPLKFDVIDKSHNNQKFSVVYTINLTENIVDICSSARRRAEEYDDVQYILESDSSIDRY